MANSKQARKRIRQIETRTEHNRTLRSRVRTYVKKFETALQSGDKKEIGTAFTQAMSELHKSASKGIMSKNTASRKISRLAARINSDTSASK